MSTLERTPYRRIKAEILERIRLGEWPPGGLIPGEQEIARTFGCARATVNRALRELAAEGVLERRRRAGTRVAAAPVRAPRVAIPLVRNEVEAGGAVYGYRLLSRDVRAPERPVRDRLELGARARALHLCCLHFADDVPYQYEDRWINTAEVPEAREAPFERTSPNEWLVRTVPFSEAEHIFRAASATPRQAECLGLVSGDALFVVERRTRRDGGIITWARLAHPAARYCVETGWST